MPLHRLPDGAEIAFDEAGEGRTLILLAGALVTRRWLDPLRAGLAEELRLVTLDYRSHGDSPPSPAGHSIGCFAEDLHHFIAARAPEEPVLAGWSMGALVAWEMVRRHADDHGLAALASICQSPSDLRSESWPDGALALEDALALARSIQADPAAAYASVFTEPWQRADALRIDPTVASLVLLDQTLCDCRDVVASTPLPTLLVAGKDDPYLTATQVDWMREHGPALEVAEIDGGHFAPLERPDQVVAALLAFADRVRGPR